MFKIVDFGGNFNFDIYSDEAVARARMLRDDIGAIIYVVNVGNQQDTNENLAIVGENNAHRVKQVEEWRGMDFEMLGPIADELCQVYF